jgi:succinyl-CoA:acetate CoA-transferase
MSRITPRLRHLVTTAEHAAAFVHDGDTLAFSCFGPFGNPDVLSAAIVAQGTTRLRLYTGASTGPRVHPVMCDALAWASPYQGGALRGAANDGSLEYVNTHLGKLAWDILRDGTRFNVAIVKVSELGYGYVTLCASVGMTPLFVRQADKLIFEVATRAKVMRGFHDLPETPNICIPKHPRAMASYGSAILAFDPARVVAIVETNIPEPDWPAPELDDVSRAIGRNAAMFLIENKVRTLETRSRGHNARSVQSTNRLRIQGR